MSATLESPPPSEAENPNQSEEAPKETWENVKQELDLQEGTILRGYDRHNNEKSVTITNIDEEAGTFTILRHGSKTEKTLPTSVLVNNKIDGYIIEAKNPLKKESPVEIEFEEYKGQEKSEVIPTKAQINELFRYARREKLNNNDTEEVPYQLAAFALQVKPAFQVATLKPSQQEFLKNKLADLGINIKIYTRPKTVEDEKMQAHMRSQGYDHETGKQYIINPALVEQRLQEEVDFAQKIGWDFNKSITENVAAHDTNIEGFVLGYPQSAIRHYEKTKQLMNSEGIPHPEYRVEPKEKLSPAKEQTITEFYQELRPIRKAQEEALKQNPGLKKEVAIKRKYSADAQKIYQKYFSISAEDVDRIIFQQFVTIPSPAGGNIYSFAVNDSEGANAPDVVALEEKVKQAFQKVK